MRPLDLGRLTAWPPNVLAGRRPAPCAGQGFVSVESIRIRYGGVGIGSRREDGGIEFSGSGPRVSRVADRDRSASAAQVLAARAYARHGRYHRRNPHSGRTCPSLRTGPHRVPGSAQRDSPPSVPRRCSHRYTAPGHHRPTAQHPPRAAPPRPNRTVPASVGGEHRGPGRAALRRPARDGRAFVLPAACLRGRPIPPSVDHQRRRPVAGCTDQRHR